MKRAIEFDADRVGYDIDQVDSPMTVGELMEMLEGLDDDVEIILSHDRGYTFGSLSRDARYLEQKNEDESYEIIDMFYV